MYWIQRSRRMDEALLFFEGLPPGSPVAILLMENVYGGTMQTAGGMGRDEVPMESFSLTFDNMQYMSLAQYLSLKGMKVVAGWLNWFS